MRNAVMVAATNANEAIYSALLTHCAPTLRLTVFRDSIAALRCAVAERPELFVLDQAARPLSGTECVTLLRAAGAPCARVILLADESDFAACAREAEVGGEYLLRIPTNGRAFRMALQGILKERPRPPTLRLIPSAFNRTDHEPR